MGPGLFLALTLAASAARAETPVGLDARGVDPMAAVDNRQGLDVRDELGRPVSAEAVLRELKRAQAARAAETAYSSALPKARLVLSALELAPGRGAWLVRLFDALPPLKAWAAPPAPRPKVPVPGLLAVACASLASAAVLRPRTLQVCPNSRQSRPEVLRC